MYSIKLKNKRLFYLDQTQLPLKEIYKECRSLRDAIRAIKRLEIRGAPLIGVFAAYSVYISLKEFSGSKKAFITRLKKITDCLRESRPTAVNLFWALEKMEKVVWDNQDKDLSKLKELLLQEAILIHHQDVKLCESMALWGVKLIKNNDTILTHCNTGRLATSGIGTALGVIYHAYKRYKDIFVYVDETRPLLQGARLTAFELSRWGVPFKLICDNMAASLMQKGLISKIFVGADRITLRGDVANKIGTYNLAVLARHHKIPFYVVAPSTTFDFRIESGEDIPIEQRSPHEVSKVLNKVQISPLGIDVFNPAFDVTEHKLISAIITEKGIIYPPFRKNIRRFFEKYERG